HGQQHWHEGHPECGGRAQSPIDIATARAQPDPSLPPLRPEGYEHPESPELSLANNGHTAVLALPPSLRLRGLPRAFAAPRLCGAGAGPPPRYRGHRGTAPKWVWGREMDEEWVGKEEGKRFGVRERRGNRVGNSVGRVIRYAGEESEGRTPNPLPARPQSLPAPPHTGQSVAIPSFSIRDLLPAHLDRYYRYNGSLTTPPCFQSVLWTLFPQPVRISRAQLEQLQGSLYSTEEAEPEEPQLLVDNFRAPQELNQRLVLSSFPRGELIAIIFGAVAGCLGLFLAVHFGVKRMR
ncbi:CAH14 anhydrase, partial [Dicaeum eximium]|nr:CAH14 anhydrase [Dicaeum eximium]